VFSESGRDFLSAANPSDNTIFFFRINALLRSSLVPFSPLRSGAFFNGMVSRKRSRSEANAPAEQPQEGHGLLTQLRNCWEFANLMQYIAIFGKIMKIDEDFGIEVRKIVFANRALFTTGSVKCRRPANVFFT
jgi:hypothetical protein